MLAMIAAPTADSAAYQEGFPEMPTARLGHACVVTSDILYCVGGDSAEGVGGWLESLDMATHIWSAKTRMPTPRTLLAAAVHNGQLFAIGGTDHQRSLDTVEAYDPMSGEWRPRSAMRVARHNHSANVAGGKIYVAGGKTVGGPVIAEVEAYDPRSDTWETISKMPSPRFGMASIVIGDEILYIGGGTMEGKVASASSMVDAFNYKTRRWSTKSVARSARVRAAAVSVKGEIYIVGGLDAAHDVVGPEVYRQNGDYSGALEVHRGGAPSTVVKIRGVSLAEQYTRDGNIIASYVWRAYTEAAEHNGVIIMVGGYQGKVHSRKLSGEVNAYPVAGEATLQSVHPESGNPDDAGMSAPPLAFDARLTSSVDSFGSYFTTDERDEVLVIGVERYKNLPRAEYASRDVYRFDGFAHSVLSSRVRTLQEESVTVANLRSVLSPSPQRSRRVYVFFSGHGSPGNSGEAYLVPWDANPNALESTALSMSEFYRLLDQLNASEVVVFLDACFSGSGPRSVIRPGARPLVNAFWKPPKPSPKISIMTASAGDEIAGSMRQSGYGVFTYFLMRAFSDANSYPFGHGVITLQDIFNDVSENVRIEARRMSREQTPQLITQNPGMELLPSVGPRGAFSRMLAAEGRKLQVDAVKELIDRQLRKHPELNSPDGASLYDQLAALYTAGVAPAKADLERHWLAGRGFSKTDNIGGTILLAGTPKPEFRLMALWSIYSQYTRDPEKPEFCAPRLLADGAAFRHASSAIQVGPDHLAIKLPVDRQVSYALRKIDEAVFILHEIDAPRDTYSILFEELH